MKKRVWRSVVSLLCVIVLAAGTCSAALAEKKTQLIIWSYSNELLDILKKYYLPNHPEVRITFKVPSKDTDKYIRVMHDKMSNKASSRDAPDLVALDAEFIRGQIAIPNFCDLADLGFTEEDYTDIYPLILEAGKTNSGKQVALSFQACPNMLFYRASLAEKYLGVTSPEEFREMVKDYPTFLETADKLAEASGGVCKMVMGTQDLQTLANFEIFGESMNPEMDSLELIRKIRAANLTHKTNQFTKEWYKGMRGETETLCYFFPMWGLRMYLAPNCGKKTNSKMTDEKLKASSEKTGGTYGDWRIVPSPQYTIWGGTWLAVNGKKAETADEAKKAAIKNLMAFLLDPDFQAQYALDNGEFVSNRKAVQQLMDNSGISFGFLNGQNPYAYMDEVMKDLHFR